jgi:hypothetical protein
MESNIKIIPRYFVELPYDSHPDLHGFETLKDVGSFIKTCIEHGGGVTLNCG